MCSMFWRPYCPDTKSIIVNQSDVEWRTSLTEVLKEIKNVAADQALSAPPLIHFQQPGANAGCYNLFANFCSLVLSNLRTDIYIIQSQDDPARDSKQA